MVDIKSLFAAPLLLHGALVVMALAGVACWLLGRTLARPLCALAGLVAGAGGGAFAGQLLGQSRYGLLLVIGCAVAGCAVAWLLFRICMGLALAAVLALVVGTLLLDWQGVGLPAVQIPALQAADLAAGGWFWLPLNEWAGDAQATCGQLLAWWDQLPVAARRAAPIGAIGGAVFGLGLGLVAPYPAASLLGSLTGAVLVMVSWTRWVQITGWGGQMWWSTAASRTVGLGLITSLGMVVQWIIFRSRSD